MSRLLLPFATAAAALCAIAPLSADQHAKPDLVTVLTAADAQTQLMAMTLTMQSMQQGAKVRVLLCGAAGDLALKDAPASATAAQKPAGMSPQGVMKKIIEAGAPVDVCAIYLPNKDLTADALLPGVGQAKPDAMAGHLIAPNTRILSF
jgi:intracellular sulfur oxidation DsrE/DsrF family protein